MNERGKIRFAFYHMFLPTGRKLWRSEKHIGHFSSRSSNGGDFTDRAGVVQFLVYMHMHAVHKLNDIKGRESTKAGHEMNAGFFAALQNHIRTNWSFRYAGKINRIVLTPDRHAKIGGRRRCSVTHHHRHKIRIAAL